MSNRPANSRNTDASQSAGGVPPQLTMNQSVGYSGMPMHMYPFSGGMVPTHQQVRAKRRQVKNACTNCQKACKKCDDARPCLRCVKYGISEDCIDSQRKERKKGIKRGPYKKRDGKDPDAEKSPEFEPEPAPAPAPQAIAIPATATSASPPIGAYVAPVGYPPGFYSTPSTGRSGEAPAYYPQFYITQVPPPPPNTDGESSAYPPNTQFYPATFLPYAQPYSSYMVPHQRPDGQMAFATFPVYQKPPSTGSLSDPSTSSGQLRMDTRMAREQEEEEEEEIGDN
jgi:hypothetical protein